MKTKSTTNLGVSGAKCFGSDGLITQVNKVPDGFKGLITIFIGVNDAGGSVTVGNVNEVIAKNFADLNADASFAEAFRLCLETLSRKAPDAIVLVIPALKTAQVAVEGRLENYRQAQRDICEYYAIPYADIYKTCKISKFTFTPLTTDGLHPSEAGHAEIARVLLPKIKEILPIEQ